ncbi:pyruvate ferredoxin oxidoreductase subunit alpha [Kurthia zopfii]|uniref:2-oxoglutarate ferredoxin oxidoreductase subunit alpha n=1 Tax=Kurthia zopfii TaxID=1650 RepID=A0A2U3AE44_9BACL|nr:2-oxoacid:acceptor oxidoreductase subunit alpha [Kurthia zopfii]PWI22800.1 2-oxoacid:acceptor oxidoreductase subunit alpha [Kurthia zopfii]TDR41841.1 2-oxoglutarate ferredoxin oxidoreductase subunit alpha [Kurthia zopfii]STX09152.1 Pyruvate synthase subunit porA [Kurthia zopfii]VEI08814.1 Pyruvate synthase subunit porA [Kurthia zopfii]GEK31310.1 pyruvate ferredoxin oxidoreductase subunit alpha [Kurthia zopfii]
MLHQLSWKVGGQQGEGIESTGEMFSTAMNRLGYHLYGYRHFSSRIKGGHTNNKINVRTTPVHTIPDDLNILVAFDQETIDVNYHELGAEGVILADAKFKPANPEDCPATLYIVPFTETAKELGTTLMKNMVAIGATAALMNLKDEVFQSVVSEIFGRKGEEVVAKNMEAIAQGHQIMHDMLAEAGLEEGQFELEQGDGQHRMFMIGNEALALGALAAGVRIMSAYPITPATEIMEYLIKKLPKFGGTVIQTEDEIAAATMAIGASYGGARSFTASAGPGLSLMMEALGLSGMTETPLVVVDTQRGGPSTGLPTKQEQSDLMAMLYGTHGEIPKVVIAPSTGEEAFYDMIQAFNIADELQIPVIMLSDLQLSLGKQTVEPFDFNKIEIKRGKLELGELPELEDKEYFKRYAVTEDGVSPRVVPGQKHGIHHVTGVEHSEIGTPSESASNRQAQMDKRMRKLDYVNFDTPVFTDAPNEEADVLIVGFGSTKGSIEEIRPLLDEQGIKANHAHIRLIHPFPTKELQPLMASAKKVIVVENNATGQLANIMKMNMGGHDKIINLVKYDGTPFLPLELLNRVKELLK